jgi:peptide/nickel transport system permease protein
LQTIGNYADTFTVDSARWSSGRGMTNELQKLVDGKVDAMVIFSDAVKNYVTGKPEFATLVVSNDALGPAHLLGTDTQGRDIFSHIVNGGTSLILTAVLAGLFSTLIAVLLGAMAAIIGGVVDTVLTSIANFVLTIPAFPLLIVLAALIKLDSVVLLAGLIGLLSWPVLMRAIRAQVLSLRERDYVEAAVALDLGLPHIILREILPNMMSFVAINFIFAITSAMYQQVGLIFLGMAPINDYTWGVMLYFGRTRGTLFSPDSASMVLSPVIAIALFQVCMVLFARSLEEMFDPRLRTAA